MTTFGDELLKKHGLDYRPELVRDTLELAAQRVFATKKLRGLVKVEVGNFLRQLKNEIE